MKDQKKFIKKGYNPWKTHSRKNQSPKKLK